MEGVNCVIISSIILYILGAISTIFGIVMNNDVEAQVVSILSGSGSNPGTVFSVIGVILLIVATILLVLGITKKKKKQQN